MMREKQTNNLLSPALSNVNNDFKNIIKSKAIFVDKSALIKEIIEDSSSVIIFLRGHGFGKSTNLSMIGNFFAKAPQHIRQQTNTASLFHGLTIWENFDKQYRNYHGKYPLLFLDFSSIKTTDSVQEVKNIIYQEIIKQYHYYNKPVPAGLRRDLGRGLKELMRLLQLDYNEECVVIIDDYDKPFQTDDHSNGGNEIFNAVMDVLSHALKGNPHLYKGILTGSFQEQYAPPYFNNFTLDTIFTRKYASYFGFTKADIATSFASLTPQEQQQLSDWYGGYDFCGKDMYHTASIVHYAQQYKKADKTYPMPKASRAETAILAGLKATHKEIIAALLAGEVMQTRLAIHFTDCYQERNTLLNALLLAGYLTSMPTSAIISEGQVIQVKIPNQDIANVLAQYVLPRLNSALSKGDLFACLGQFYASGVAARHPEEIEKLTTLIMSDHLADATALVDVIKNKNRVITNNSTAGYAQAISQHAHGSPLHQKVRQDEDRETLVIAKEIEGLRLG